MDKSCIGFLVKAKKAAQAAGAPGKIEPSRPNAHDFEYKEDRFKYYDSFLGSGKFAGQEGLWKQEMPIWAMNYTGRVLALGFSEEFLKKALMQVDEDVPLRGPAEYADGDYLYKCSYEGSMKWFSGREEIFHKGKLVYECIFNGGEVLD